nr:MAG: MT-A70 [Bacteriophage sp.]
MTHAGPTPAVATDPPFDIGYRHKGLTDRMDGGDCCAMPAEVTAQTAAVVIRYPGQLHRLSIERGEASEGAVSRAYDPNTRKQHRDVAFYGVKPDFNRVRRPYRNRNGKRIRKLMAEGKGARPCDRWNVNRVKNVSKVKTGHPCQMPIQVMESIIGILPDGIGAIDPFLGSGTSE